MKLRQSFISLLAGLLTCLLLASCSAPSAETDSETQGGAPDHSHEYYLEQTFEGDCTDRGYQLYTCACGESFKSLIPSTHVYDEIRDNSGKYVKRVCDKCGDYSIRREQTYTFCVDFEGAQTIEDAGNKPPHVAYYGSAGTSAEIVKTDDGTVAKLVARNYYLLDTSEVIKKGKTFVLSFDVAFETFGSGAVLSLIPFVNGGFSYNDGLIEIAPTGKLSFCNSGNSQYNEDVKLSDKGYNNITVVGSARTGLYDVYVNETLVRKDVSYVKTSDNLTEMYIRYLDRDTGGTAYIDNLKLYVAETPEFVIDESKIYFTKP